MLSSCALQLFSNGSQWDNSLPSCESCDHVLFCLKKERNMGMPLRRRSLRRRYARLWRYMDVLIDHVLDVALLDTVLVRAKRNKIDAVPFWF